MSLPSVRRIRSLLVLALGASGGLALAADNVFPPLVNWPAPATFSPHTASRGVSTMSDLTDPVPFIPTTPCRQFDIRPGTLLDNTNLSVTLTGAPCGIPTSAVAVSVNITVFSITGAGGNGVFQVGTATNPTFAWINYPPTESQRGNAGALPLNGSNQIFVKVNQGGGSIQLTVDVNGYYYSGNKNGTSYLAAGEQFSVAGTVGGGSVIVAENNSSTNGSRALRGFETSATGINYGVRGDTVSTAAGTAGLLGLDLSTPLPDGYQLQRAGVIGACRDQAGVIGVTEVGFGDAGVIGKRVNSLGVVESYGSLGWSSLVGVYYGNGLTGFGAKNFVEPHATDASKFIKYVSLEGPESGTYFRGTAHTVRGQAVITVPEDYRMVTDDDGLTVQLTPVGASANVWIVSEDLNQIVVRSSRDVTFHYTVNGVRRAYKNWNPIQDSNAEERFFIPESPDAKMPAYYPEELRNRLIANGTYNPDGTVNLQTARALGWDKVWEQRGKRVEPTRATPPADPNIR